MLRRRSTAFTMLEILVVSAIILLIAGMTTPALRSARASARRTQCMSNLRQWALMDRLYMNDHKGMLPRSY
ncbi:MAG: type II secretion system protein, partial [Verrucomicrobiae bacterium]|nr:type II secretion system protein [Verrucomicrobiae bacterium]